MRNCIFTVLILAAAVGFITIVLLPIGRKTVPLPATMTSWLLVGTGVVLMVKKK